MPNSQGSDAVCLSLLPNPSPPPPFRLLCSLGVTSLTFFGDIIPDGVGPGPVVAPPAGARGAPAGAATPSMPLAFSTALLSPAAQESRLTNPRLALRPAASRRLDSSRARARFCSRRGPGPQSCMQPGVAQPPSLMAMSFSHVVIQAKWPPCPQPWHHDHRAEPKRRGTV